MLNIEDTLFRKVIKPARYTGGEWNSIKKDWGSFRLHVALAFPDIYEVGASNMAIPILYQLLNNMPEVLAERVYAPWADMEQQLRENNLPLFSLETRHPIAEFDMLGFSLGYELSCTSVLNMLDLAGIPVFSKDRDGRYPLVIAGGSYAMNPEPLSDFIDLFFIGEIEEAMSGIVEAFCRHKENRHELIRKLARLPGIYVPRFYTPHYKADGMLSSMQPVEPNAPASIERVVTSRLTPVIRPPLPYIEVIHDRAAVEIQRGCSRGCRFCQAGILYRPVRELPEDQALESVDCLLRNTGHNTVSLVSLSTGDYSHIESLVQKFTRKYSQSGTTLSLPSLRLDKSSVELINSLPLRHKTTLTFAPEAGSDRLRRAINKWISEEAMMETFTSAFEKEWMNLKLYFMVGLPTETLDDVEAIAGMLEAVNKLGRNIRGRSPRVRVSVSSFVPKPHTPCQWAAQDSEAALNQKHTILQSRLRRSGVHLSWHDTRASLLEAVLSRGDRRLGSVIYTAWKKGSRLDTWNEFLDFNRWEQAFDECGIDPYFYAQRVRDVDELLPWQHISPGVSSGFLAGEQLKMSNGELTEDCRSGDCSLCGMQNKYGSCKVKAQKSKDRPKFDFKTESR